MSSDPGKAVINTGYGAAGKAPGKRIFLRDTRKAFGDARTFAGERLSKVRDVSKDFYKKRLAIGDENTNFFIRNSFVISIIAWLMIAIGLLIIFVGYDNAPPDSQKTRDRAAFFMFGAGIAIVGAIAILSYYQIYG